jgi:hypothetical protein
MDVLPGLLPAVEKEPIGCDAKNSWRHSLRLTGLTVKIIAYLDTLAQSLFTDMARHDRMVALVERILELHKRLAVAQSQTDQELCQHQISRTAFAKGAVHARQGD